MDTRLEHPPDRAGTAPGTAPATGVRTFFMAVLVGLVTLGLLETAARLVLPYNPSFGERAATSIRYGSSGLVSFYLLPDQVIYESDAGRIVEDRVRYRINAHGFRGADFPEQKAAGEIRLAILGGSHVFDQNTFEYEGNPGFPRLIQDAFREEGVQMTVINAGVPGADTRYFPARVVMQLRRFEPDIVVINSIWNDLKWISRTTASTEFLRALPMAGSNPLIEPAGRLDAVLGRSVFYRHARDAYWRRALALDPGSIEGALATAPPALETVDLHRGLAQYGANLDATVSAIRNAGAIPVLAIEERLVRRNNTEAAAGRTAYQYVNVADHDALVRLFESCDSVIRDVALRREVLLIDADVVLAGDPRYFTDHVHTTPAGSRRIADHYVDALRPIVRERSADRPVPAGTAAH